METKINFGKLPSKSTTHKFVDELYDFLFPVEANFHDNEDLHEEKMMRLKIILGDALLPLEGNLPATREHLISSFLDKIPDIRQQLIKDALLFIQSDPAAECIEEVIIAYPGFYAIAVYRIAHNLYDLKIPILPRIVTEYAHTKTGIDIHPGAEIGVPFFIDHGTGVVIGQTTIIGNSVKLYQGVTLGALAVRKETEGTKRHPTIEDNVIIYAGSCILGGNTTIGNDSVIGGNVWLTETVPAFSIVYHKSDVKIRDKSEMNSVIDYVI
jgi:serine O-acetyltransferase